MKSKTSCFNKTIFKKNMTHYWPIWILYLCLLLFELPLSLWLNMQNYSKWEDYTRTQVQQMVIWHTFEKALNPYVTFTVAIIAVMAVFSYLYSARSTNMMHALPVSRGELFVTNFCSAAAFMVIPQLIVFLISIFTCMALHITNLEYILFWLGAMLGVSFFALALGAFTAMFTGQLWVLPCYYFIVNFLYVGVCFIITTLIETCSFGISSGWSPDKSCILSPVYYLGNNLRITPLYDDNYDISGIELKGGYLVLIYLVAAVIFLVAAYQLYQRRQLEKAGDLITMNWIKPIFRWGCGVCIGIGLGIVLADTVRSKNCYKGADFVLLLVLILVVEAMAFFAAEMMIQKNFRIFRKKRIAEWALLAVLTVVFVSLFEYDAFGIEKKIPKLAEVERAVINFDYSISYQGEEIQEVLDLQSDILAQKEDFLKADQTMYVNLTYYMKDKTVMNRMYPVPVDYDSITDENTVASKLIAIETEPENLSAYMFGANYESNEYYAGNITFTDEDGREDEYRFSKEELEEIVNAVRADIREGNFAEYQLYALAAYDEYSYLKGYSSSIVINYYNPDGINWEYGDYTYDTVQSTAETAWQSSNTYYNTNGTAYISFGPGCTNIVNTLKKLGIVNEERRLLTNEEYNDLMN